MLWAMRKAIKYLSIILVALFVSGLLLLFFSPKPSLLEEFNFSKAVYDENQQLLRLILSEDDKYRLYVPLSQIPKELIE
ncbi:TPA: penicillin-binding protein 1C, partial [Legionella pneumophila]|nr:penicillin-binding protein 1C [Legionella pneumophila]